MVWILRAWNVQTLFFFLQITKFQLISFVHSGRKSPKKSHFKPNSLLTEPSAPTYSEATGG